jgi:hypothetical protein
LIARKRDEASDNSAVVCATQFINLFINLWSNPKSSAQLKRFMRRVHAARAMPRPEPARPRQPRHPAPSSDAARLFARMFGE